VGHVSIWTFKEDDHRYNNFVDFLRISLPEVREAVEEGAFVVQKYGVVVRFRYVDWRPGTHVTKGLVRRLKSVV
jgi:hypothetical protein